MKTVARIVLRIAVILAAALVVVGATAALSSSGALNAELLSRRPGREGFMPGDGANALGERHAPDNERSDTRRGGRQGGFFGEGPVGRQGSLNTAGLQEVIRNLTTVLIIVAAFVVVALTWRLFRRAIQKRTGPPPSRPIQA